MIAVLIDRVRRKYFKQGINYTLCALASTSDRPYNDSQGLIVCVSSREMMAVSMFTRLDFQLSRSTIYRFSLLHG